jgi:hypothetical protein
LYSILTPPQPRDDESDEEEVPAKYQPKRSLAASMSAVPPPDDESDEEEETATDEPSGDNEAKIDLMLEEYLTGGDIDDALQCLKEFKATIYNEFVNRVRGRITNCLYDLD